MTKLGITDKLVLRKKEAGFLTEIAERNGFRITNKWGYKIKNRYMRFDRNGRGGIIDIDWVLDLVRV